MVQRSDLSRLPPFFRPYLQFYERSPAALLAPLHYELGIRGSMAIERETSDIPAPDLIDRGAFDSLAN